MERVDNYKGKKGLILKTLGRCCSLGHRRSHTTSMPKSKSWQRSSSTVKHRIAPGGYFSVYVGPNKERFVIKMECVNHPLFKDLLDEAEMEYGFKSEGPLELPCDVDLFCRVLCEIDQEMIASPKCGFAKISNGYRLLSPTRVMVMGQFCA
ncbi:indole-3-acetic acid-induced protein ARG7-like [Cocos nucifera]|uniref:Indole-3-acetic acid-induced protein ARG7-like n=1 Tax=Cocos nucifera TaxID=13894 RepID=A0A8K0NDJ9_COCNU|nr:indole-3-acetic acid-induced protein ARG7-like [Cocos nucifera]